MTFSHKQKIQKLRRAKVQNFWTFLLQFKLYLRLNCIKVVYKNGLHQANTKAMHQIHLKAMVEFV